MRTHLLLWSVVALVAVAGVVAAGLYLRLPPRPTPWRPPAVPPAEVTAALEALKPPKRARPVVAILGVNAGTELTDYLMPFGVLKRSGVVEVLAVATGPGPVRLYPALSVQPDATAAGFDTRYPDGADYVIVPAMRREDDPAALAWIRAQAAKGATVIGVCAGAKVVANAGLLDGRRGTSHWWYLRGLRKEHPAMTYVADRRLVVDGPVATTTGITASMPAALTLVEAIAGRARADRLAAEVGLPQWSLRHDSSAFGFTRAFARTAIGARLAFWRREDLGLALGPGIDEVALALVADAWSRTWRGQAKGYAPAPVTSGGGLRIIPDVTAADWPAARRLPSVNGVSPAVALDHALTQIAARYGAASADFAAAQLEYPRTPSASH